MTCGGIYVVYYVVGECGCFILLLDEVCIYQECYFLFCRFLSMSDATCDKCDEYYTDPRMLPCLHTFCLQCLEKELEKQNSKDTLQCPNCKEKVTLPQSGVSGLPQDLHMANEAERARIGEKVEKANEQCDHCGRSDSGQAVAFCVDCDEFLCRSCDDHHKKWRKTVEHTRVSAGERVKASEDNTLSRFYQQLRCPTHKKYELEFYCKKCEKLICRNCMDFEHNNHRENCNLMEKFAQQEIEGLQGCVENCQGALHSLDTAIMQCEKTMQQIETRKKEVDGKINDSLEQVRTALLAQNEEIQTKKTKNLKAQVQRLQWLRDGLSHAAGMITDTQSHSPAQQLSTKKTLAERATKLQKTFKETKLVPSESDVFITDIDKPDTIRKMISLGNISGGSHAASSTCDFGYVPCAVVGVPQTIKVVVRDEAGKQIGHGGEKVEVKLVVQGSQTPAITGETTDHGDGSYSAIVTPQSTGQHELQVTIAYGHVRGSPFKIHVISPRKGDYTTLSAQQYVNTFSHPFDVAVIEAGQLAVAEYGYHTVSLYSATGQKIHSFGNANSAGSTDGQFSSPSGVAIKDDLMYVSDQGNSRVQKFSVSQRSYISKFGSNGQGNGQFSSPRGICIDPEGKVYIADFSNHRIQVFHNDDSFAYSFNCQSHPWGLAFDLQGRLHVAAYGSNCIRVFTPKGTEVTSYGTGTLSYPAGIAINAEGYIAISQWSPGSLWIYSPDHTLIHTIENQFSSGVGIACDQDGFFWVADHGNSRVTKY